MKNVFLKESVLLLLTVNIGLAARFVFEQYSISSLENEYRSIFVKIWICINIGMTIGSGAIRNVILQHHNNNIKDAISIIGKSTIMKAVPIQVLALISMVLIIGGTQFENFFLIIGLALIVTVYEINVQIQRVNRGPLRYSFWGFLYPNFCILSLVYLLSYFDILNLHTIFSVIAATYLSGILAMSKLNNDFPPPIRETKVNRKILKREYWLAVILYISWIIKERSILLAFGNQQWETELVNIFLAFRIVQILGSFKSAVYNFLISRIGQENYSSLEFQKTYIKTVYFTTGVFLGLAALLISTFELIFQAFNIIYFENFEKYLKILILMNLILTTLGPFQTVNQLTNKTGVELSGTWASIGLFISLFLISGDIKPLALIYWFVVATTSVEVIKFIISTKDEKYYGIRKKIILCVCLTIGIWICM